MNLYSSSILMPTALLICMENTFWTRNVSGDDSFVELFKKSFKLYVESGTRMKLEAAINILRNDSGQGGHLVTDSEDFKAKFYMLITEHLLRKFHCFFVLETSSNHFLHLNTARPVLEQE
jgi:hypothetical protein